MAPSRPAPSLVVRTPRHASQRVRPTLAAEIRRLAKQRNAAPIELDEKLVVIDPAHPLGIASDNASEWNSLLITARAERGPQWDVATQRFMVDYGSSLYFDSTPLVFPEEPTPAVEEPSPQGLSQGSPSSDPSTSWQSDPRFAQYGGNGSINLGSVATPPRTSLRLQHQQSHQQQPLNGHHGNGIGFATPQHQPQQYTYPITNGRSPQQHFEQQQSPSYYDGSQSQHQHQHQLQNQNHGHGHHAMANGIGGVSPMMSRQNSMSIGMGMEFGMGGGAPGTPSPDMRRRTRSQQDTNMEMGW